MDAMNASLFQQGSRDLTPAVPYFTLFVMILWIDLSKMHFLWSF
jgi:hypothetical protein